tara:strand:+ start:1778 stop:1918 length:141 start_codon:yes stop_codon:yes gene_type:complete
VLEVSNIPITRKLLLNYYITLPGILLYGEEAITEINGAVKSLLVTQ